MGISNSPQSIGKIDGSVTKDNVRKVRVYCSTVTSVTAGTPVSLDPGDSTHGLGKSCKVSVIDDDPLCFGIIVEDKTVTTGQPVGKVLVQVSGPIQDADAYCPTAQGAIAINKAVGANNSTNAKRIKEVGTCAAAIQPFAVCIEAFGDGAADGAIMIIDKGWF